MGLVVAGGLVVGLLSEALALVEGIVEFRVRIADLLGGTEELETLAQARDLAMATGLADATVGTIPFGEGAHHLRVVGDEGGVDALDLEVFADKLVG